MAYCEICQKSDFEFKNLNLRLIEKEDNLIICKTCRVNNFSRGIVN